MRIFTFETARKVAEDFEELLSRLGLAPVPGGSLERMTLNVYDVMYHRGANHVSTEGDVRILLSDLAAQIDLPLQLVRLQGHPEFANLVPHLKLLNAGEAALNRRSNMSDQASNKLFELLAGCLAMRCGTNVTLDHPNHSRGDNPDVLATIRGRRWGIACKVLHSLNARSIMQNVEEGLRQIRCSTAEVGFVFLSLRNVIDHPKYWPVQNRREWERGAEPVFQAFVDVNIPRIFLEAEIDSIGASIRQLVNVDDLRTLFDSSRSLRGVVLYPNVMSAVTGPSGKPAPMCQRWLAWAGTDGASDEETAVLECLNRAAQDIP